MAELRAAAQHHPQLIVSTIVGGIVYQWGMRIWLYVIATRGLIFTTSITSSVTLIVGTTGSAVAGGLASGASVPLLVTGTLVLLLAILAITAATAMRESATRRLEREPERRGTGNTRLPLWISLLLCVLTGLCTSAYPTAIALGLRSHLRPEGLSVLTFMAVLATGAAIGAAASSGLWLTVRHQWGCALHAPKRYYAYGILAGFAHYGGNIINAFAVPVISPTIAWPIGTTSSLWGVAWGYVYREYRGAPRQVFGFQIAGVNLFVAGVALLTVAR